MSIHQRTLVKVNLRTYRKNMNLFLDPRFIQEKQLGPGTEETLARPCAILTSKLRFCGPKSEFLHPGTLSGKAIQRTLKKGFDS